MTSSVRTFLCFHRGEVDNEDCYMCWTKMNAKFREVNEILSTDRPSCKYENVIGFGEQARATENDQGAPLGEVPIVLSPLAHISRGPFEKRKAKRRKI